MTATPRIVLITGAASGIGRAMVDAFRNEYAAVVAVDIDDNALSGLESNAGVSARQADVSDRGAVESLVDSVLAEHGQIDVLCNNAGIPDRFEGVSECTDETWQRILAVNLSGAFYACRRTVPAMLAAGRGVIVNTASVAGFRGGEAGVAYTVAKHGLIGLTQSIAAMYGDDGVRCVAICPGPVTTGITAVNAGRRERGEMSARGLATAAKTGALRQRWLSPSQVAEIAVFAASDAASALNGCAIPADGGRMVY
jgi:NAD(P)-dependent dehydrogenase (short-subunit alcohol dehydrogenase family)